MFKDYDKYLTTSLKVYLFVLIIIFIMKIVGLDYFGLDINNPSIIKVSEFCLKWHLDIIYSYVNCYINSLIVISIVCDDNSKKAKIYTLICFPLIIFCQYLKQLSSFFIIHILIDYIVFIGICYLHSKRIQLFKYTKLLLFFILLQFLSVIIRNQSLDSNTYNFIVSFIMNFDYLLMTIIFYKLYFLKGGKSCYQEEEVYLSSLKKLNLKKSLTKLQKNWLNFKKLDKVSKLTFIIYFILSLIWNTLSVLLILLVARLNDTFIECIFILTSFWLSKKAFGKAFHLKSMAQCFIVSNLTYYVLNRITTPIGISIIIPIMLGVGLSYVTSKLVKKKYKPLYKGMPEDLFEETILKVTDKNSIKYKICYDFYIKNKSVVSLALKYNYSEVGIRKIKDRINNKIKGLE